MKLRAFDGEPIRGRITSDLSVSPDGGPILLVNDEPFSPEEAEFFLESATERESEMLEEGGCDLPEWEAKSEEYEEGEEGEEIEPDEDCNRNPNTFLKRRPRWANLNLLSNLKSNA